MPACRWIQHRILPVIALAVVLALLGTGCANKPATIYVKQQGLSLAGKTVLVAPLLNWSNNPKAGLVVAELVSMELASYGHRVIGPAEAAKALNLDDYNMDETLDQEKVLALARKLSVDRLLWGAVSEYAYRPGLYDEPTVGVDLKLIDVASGSVIWAAGQSAGPACLTPCDMTVSQLARNVCAELIATMFKN